MPKDSKDENFGLGSGKQPTISTKHLSRLFNLTGARISQLTQEKVLTKAARGRYPLYDSVQSYISYLQTRKVNQWDGDENPSDIKKEQLRRTKEEADKLELQNAKTRGELVEAEMAGQAIGRVCAILKSKVQNSDLSADAKREFAAEVLKTKQEWAVEDV